MNTFKSIIALILTGPAWIWIGLCFRILEPELWKDLYSFMSQREKWKGPNDE